MSTCLKKFHHEKKVKISIITTFKDDHRELLLTIKSIQSQQGVEFFHILLDASESESQNVEIKRYLNSKNTQVIPSQGLGQYACLNKGISLVQSRYFLLMNTGTTFVHSFSVFNALKDSSAEDLIINRTTVISLNQRNFTPLINKTKIPFGIHHEACFYSKKQIMHDLDVGHIADLDFISKHLLNSVSIQINKTPLIYYPRGGVSDQRPIDKIRIKNTFKVSGRLILRRQHIAALLLSIRAIKDILLYLKK